jgi:zinc protease
MSFALIILTINGFGQNLNKNLPQNKDIKIGKLENGLTYYICKNKELQNRASFYLVENVGAVVEEDDQNGMAHFLEHMGLNGLKHFQGNEMEKYLRKKGLKFGQDWNAFTNKTETYYQFTKLPTNDSKLVDSCILILSDLAHGIMFEPKEIEKEKGVVIEEWRQTSSIDKNIEKRLEQNIFNNSRYSQRDVIGDMNIIRNANKESLMKFYNDWYRTDLQAVIVVGDINIKEIEAGIKKHFSKIKAVENPKQKPEIRIKNYDGINFSVIKEKGIGGTLIDISITHKQENQNYKSLAFLKNNLMINIFNAITRDRLANAMRNDEKNFQYVNISYSSIVQPYMKYSISLAPKPGNSNAAIKEVIAINNDIVNKGFNAVEFLKAKSKLLYSVEDIDTENISNEDIVRQCMEHFLRKQALTDHKKLKPILVRLINGLDLSELNQRIKYWYNNGNKAISFITGTNENNDVLSKPEVLKYFENKADSFDIEDELHNNEKILLTDVLKSGEITNIKKIEKLGAELWTLSNGAKIVYKYTKSSPGALGFWGESKGGYSLIPTEDLQVVSWINDILSFGLGDHNKYELQKILENKAVRLNMLLTETKETFSGAALETDFQHLLELVYMLFEKPRFDEQTFLKLKDQKIKGLINSRNNANKLLNDNVNLIMTDNHERTIIETSESQSKLKLEDIKRIYNQRYSNASDWIFYLIGDISKSKAKKIVAKYIGAIKSKDESENFINHNILLPKASTKKIISLDLGKNVAKNTYLSRANIDFNNHNKYCLKIAAAILNSRLSDLIREKEGGTYMVNVSQYFQRIPQEFAEMKIEFLCSLENQQKLMEISKNELANITEHGISDNELNDVKNYFKKNINQIPKDANYWLSSLKNYIEYKKDYEDFSKSKETINKITTNDIQDFVNKFIEISDNLEIIILSKKEVQE